MPAMSEAAARSIAVLRRQADRHRTNAHVHRQLIETGLDVGGVVAGEPADHEDRAALCELAADLAERHARAKAALLAAYEPKLAARVHAASDALSRGEGTVEELRAAFTLRHEDACPVEYEAVAAAAQELQATARTWRLIGDALGKRPGAVAEDNVDDTPDPAVVAALMEA